MVENEDDLPELWHNLANADKKQDFIILRKVLETFAASDQVFFDKAPIISNKLKDDILTFTFHGTTRDDYGTGLSPFAIMDGNEANRTQNIKLAKTYGLLASSELHLNYSDLQLLEDKEICSLPLTYFELKRTLGMFGNLLAVVLGAGHPLTDAYDQFWYMLVTIHEDMVYQLIDTPMVGQTIKPVHILRSIQLTSYNWFLYNKARHAPIAFPPADYTIILHQLTNASYKMPHLPPVLYKLANPTRTGPLSHSMATTASLSQASVGSATGSDVSSLTTPTIKPGRGTFQANTAHVDRNLQTLVSSNLMLKLLIGDTTPQLSDDTQPVPLCLAYQFRHGCWTGCNRANTH